MRSDKPRRTLFDHIIELAAAIVALGLVTVLRKRFGEGVTVIALVLVTAFVYYRRQKQAVFVQDLSATGTQDPGTKKYSK